MFFCGFHGFLCQVPTETLVAPLLLLDDKPLEVHKHHFFSGAMGCYGVPWGQVESFEEARARCSSRSTEVETLSCSADVQIQFCFLCLGILGILMDLGADVSQKFTTYFDPGWARMWRLWGLEVLELNLELAVFLERLTIHGFIDLSKGT